MRKRKPSPATVPLANFFKFKAKADNIPYGDLSSEKPASEILYNLPLGINKTPAGQSKRTATSLILFEEVNQLASEWRSKGLICLILYVSQNIAQQMPTQLSFYPMLLLWIKGLLLGCSCAYILLCWCSHVLSSPQVDIIFDDDVGFLTAVKTFMTTTKRPVILTTNGKCILITCTGSCYIVIGTSILIQGIWPMALFLQPKHRCQ